MSEDGSAEITTRPGMRVMVFEETDEVNLEVEVEKSENKKNSWIGWSGNEVSEVGRKRMCCVASLNVLMCV